MLFHDMALMDLTYVVKQTCQKWLFWPFYSKKVHVCHCKANGSFLMQQEGLSILLQLDSAIDNVLDGGQDLIDLILHWLRVVHLVRLD